MTTYTVSVLTIPKNVISIIPKVLSFYHFCAQFKNASLCRFQAFIGLLLFEQTQFKTFIKKFLQNGTILSETALLNVWGMDKTKICLGISLSGIPLIRSNETQFKEIRNF
ncbi:hypothetical protein V6R21_23715 [Limibacter armeniacum]|uniref:hypothetical protein n=1 Tax=Limibacter armeniacum TaxID=466084 RepID=UPI002FE54070